MDAMHVETETGETQTPVAGFAPHTNGAPKDPIEQLRLIKSKKAKPHKVLFPEPYKDIDWYIRKGSVGEREAWERENTIRKNGRDQMQKQNVRANLLIKASVREDGTPMFEANKEWREFINDLPGDLVEYAFDDVLDLWGIKKKDADEIEAGNS